MFDAETYGMLMNDGWKNILLTCYIAGSRRVANASCLVVGDALKAVEGGCLGDDPVGGAERSNINRIGKFSRV